MPGHMGAQVAGGPGDQHLHADRSSRAMKLRKKIIPPASNKTGGSSGPLWTIIEAWRNYNSVLASAVPTSPGRGIARQVLSRDIAQRLVNPTVGLRVQRGVVCIIQQLRNYTVTLILG